MSEGQKPLFVPLKRQWFEKIERGEKTDEYREYGPRWNFQTCRSGRSVVLSLGYSGRRLSARVVGATKIAPEAAPPEAAAIYPNKAIIAIHLADVAPLQWGRAK